MPTNTYTATFTASGTLGAVPNLKQFTNSPIAVTVTSTGYTQPGGIQQASVQSFTVSIAQLGLNAEVTGGCLFWAEGIVNFVDSEDSVIRISCDVDLGSSFGPERVNVRSFRGNIATDQGTLILDYPPGLTYTSAVIVQAQPGAATASA